MPPTLMPPTVLVTLVLLAPVLLPLLTAAIYLVAGWGPRTAWLSTGSAVVVLAAVITLVLSTLVMILVALVGAASFMVIAQRRLPQMGYSKTPAERFPSYK